MYVERIILFRGNIVSWKMFLGIEVVEARIAVGKSFDSK